MGTGTLAAGEILGGDGNRPMLASSIWFEGSTIGEQVGIVAEREHDRSHPDEAAANGRSVHAPATGVMARPLAERVHSDPNRLHLAVEALLVGQSFWLVGLAVAGGWPSRDFRLGASLIIPLAAIVFFFLKRSKLNGCRRSLATFRDSIQASLQGSAAVAVLLSTLSWLVLGTPGMAVATGTLGLAFAMAVSALFEGVSVGRLRRPQARVLTRGLRRVALLGHDRACRTLAEQLSGMQDSLLIVGTFALAEGAVRDGLSRTNADPVSAIVGLAGEGEIDDVILVPHTLDDPLLVPAIERLSAYAVDIVLGTGAIGQAVADLAPGPGSPAVPLLPLVKQPIRGRGARAKHALDVVASSLAILVLLPVFAIIALAIKLDSPGPVLFKQKRLGLNQKAFLLWKFRTMHCGSDGVGADFQQATRRDRRITRVGRVLRRLSLDELPQLGNVLWGEMSLVGPRPHPLPLNKQFAEKIALYSARHRVLPGITGLAQISGCRGETDTLEKMCARVDYDLQYIRNWSLWLDLRIIALTVLGRFTHANAY
jgi:exopolysaccharide biosynthesis polyprenyl glycosylphosphotransferase